MKKTVFLYETNNGACERKRRLSMRSLDQADHLARVCISSGREASLVKLTLLLGECFPSSNGVVLSAIRELSRSAYFACRVDDLVVITLGIITPGWRHLSGGAIGIRSAVRHRSKVKRTRDWPFPFDNWRRTVAPNLLSADHYSTTQYGSTIKKEKVTLCAAAATAYASSVDRKKQRACWLPPGGVASSRISSVGDFAAL